MQQIIQLDFQRYQPAMAQAECISDGLREPCAVTYLQTLRIPRAVDDAERAAEKASQARARYAEHQPQETARTRRYKLAHPERKIAMDAVRNARITAQADGTVSSAVIKRLKQAATHCAYCGVRLIARQTDHMIPLALGGEHSLRNIVVVCPGCNQRKHVLNFWRWVERIEPQHRARVVTLFGSRYGWQNELRAAA